MDFKEYKELNLRELRDAVKFFSNKGKKKRELWVVKEFLRILGLSYSEGELNQLLQDPPDVIFRDSHFEIKELMDENRHRHKEFKNRLKMFESAQSFDDIRDNDGWDQEALTIEELSQKVEKYIQDKIYGADMMAKTDLLIYVNPIKNYIDKNNLALSVPKDSAVRRWRSVTLLFNGGVTYILFTSPGAPVYIRALVGRVIKK